MTPSFRTSQLVHLLDRIQVGDPGAEDELFQHVVERLERLARKMLRGFPAVRRWEQTPDVMQKAMLRLLQALRRQQRPASTRAFMAQAGNLIRWELKDLKRHYYGPEGMGRHHHTDGAARDLGAPAHEPADPSPGWDELEEWGEFHEQVEKLPEEEREVVNLHFYQGLPKKDIAELLGVDVRTIQRRWNGALQRLHSRLRSTGPAP
jgi:RNA polymerase sigma factor (sigma-70 family)